MFDIILLPFDIALFDIVLFDIILLPFDIALLFVTTAVFEFDIVLFDIALFDIVLLLVFDVVILFDIELFDIEPFDIALFDVAFEFDLTPFVFVVVVSQAKPNDANANTAVNAKVFFIFKNLLFLLITYAVSLFFYNQQLESCRLRLFGNISQYSFFEPFSQPFSGKKAGLAKLFTSFVAQNK